MAHSRHGLESGRARTPTQAVRLGPLLLAGTLIAASRRCDDPNRDRAPAAGRLQRERRGSSPAPPASRASPGPSPRPRQHPTHGSVGSCARRPCQGPRQHCGIGFSVLNAEFRIPKIRPRAARRRQGPRRSRDRAPPQSIPAALMNERATALSTGTRKRQRCFVDSKSFFLALKQNTFTF